jgi:modulator of FtsH protease HflK
MDIDINLPKNFPRKDVHLPAWLPTLAIAVAAVLLLLSGLYSVSTDSVGVVQRFGRFVKVVDPGLQWRIPLGVDMVTPVPVKRQLKQEFGFGTPGAANAAQFSPRDQWVMETTMVTGDLNTALVEWIIQYRVEQPELFLFRVRHPGETLRDVSESVMREVVGDRTVDEVLTVGRQEIEMVALERMQEVVNKYEMGLRIDQVQLKNVNPPKPVQASFDEVNEAQQEREKMINIARGEYNKAVPRARGEADQKIQEAEGYAIQRVNEAEGDANRFNAVLVEYLKAPEVTKRRLHLETMAAVLPRLKSKIILDADANSVLPLLQLDAREGGAR